MNIPILNRRRFSGGLREIPFDPFDIDEGAITATNLTNATAVTFVATDVDGSTQIAQTMGSIVIAWSTGLDVSTGANHVRHTMVSTSATDTTGFFLGFAINNGGVRDRIQFHTKAKTFWTVGTTIPSGNFATGVGPSSGSVLTTVVADYFFRPAENSVTVKVSFDGEAPYTFRIANVQPGQFELLTKESSTVLHTLETRTIELPALADLAIDPSVMHAPLALTPRTPPSGWTATIPGGYEFYENGGAYSTSVSLRPPLAAADYETIEVYVDIATGSDTNAGTAAAPLKSLRAAADRFQAAGRGIIKAKGGLYPYADCFRNYLKGSLVQIESWNGADVISSMHKADFSWSASSGAYVATLATGTVDSVFDAAFTDADGDYQELTKESTIAAVQATPGTWFQSGTSVYVHTSDSRTPDANLRAYVKGVGGGTDEVGIRVTESGSVLYLDKIRFEGGYYPMQLNSAASSGYLTLYAKDSAVKYCGNLSGWSVISNGLVVLQGCTGALNMSDGANYKPSSAGGSAPIAIEIGCSFRKNGRDASGTSNASSGHGAKVIRANTLGIGNKDWTFHDIDQSGNQGQTWNLGCIAGDPVNPAVANWAAGISGGSDTTLVWLDGCKSYGAATYDLAANASAVLRHYGLMDEAGDPLTPVELINDLGTIATYTP